MLYLAGSVVLSRKCTVVCVNHNLSLCLSAWFSHWNTHTETPEAKGCGSFLPLRMHAAGSPCLFGCWTTAMAYSSANASHCSSPALHSCDVLARVFVHVVYCLRVALVDSCVWEWVCLCIQTCVQNVEVREWTLWSHNSKHKQGLLVLIDSSVRSLSEVNQMGGCVLCCHWLSVVEWQNRWELLLIKATQSGMHSCVPLRDVEGFILLIIRHAWLRPYTCDKVKL